MVGLCQNLCGFCTPSMQLTVCVGIATCGARAVGKL